MNTHHFPETFLWGTAISAYQSEGNNYNNDWYHYELEEQAKPVQHRRIREPCGLACDHWNRYETDFDLAAQLGIQLHRLSIEWSRVCPQKDVIDYRALDHYKAMLAALKHRNIKVMLCLHHFTIPAWLFEMGGFRNGSAVVHNYSKYATTVVEYLGDQVDYWLTVNEPNALPLASYMAGIFPPFKRNILSAIRVFRTFVRMHAQAYRIIKSHYPDALVSASYAHTGFAPYNRHSPIDRLITWHMELVDRRFFDGIRTGRLYYPLGVGDEIEHLKGSMDFLGVNYFFRAFVKGFHATDENGNDIMGAYMGDGLFYPEGLYHKIKSLYQRLRLPVIVTENGTPTNDEAFRIEYLKAHVREVHRAIGEGIPVRGYMCWSLLDNFEWQQGYKERFGLIHVDYGSQTRTIKESGRWFAKVIQANAI